ncbi:tRNA-queuosine alpha-mannosyltransferase domain-containing protein [Marinobacter sp. JSM 1782161]|uniref:tRNA-queuosine alpha-mannosyltransferase domain-containing protein n=1 Tax=Marinobacter sp. JSM 1782161 TaxID=2685906 RepID=UPI001402F9CB|nr:DUF3524 domain-containing protein [Marinobacter sp. JSM 1782161]
MTSTTPSSSRPRLLLLSGYDAGSHQSWREQLVASQPDFDWQSLILPPRYFRWRIRGNALSWLDEPALSESWDAIVATSMVDLAGLRAFHPHLARTPVLLYMHENQFAYPDSGDQHSSVDHQMVTLYSALAADRIAFNSEWNRTSFLDGVAALLKRLPDRVPGGVVERIRVKSTVLPVPVPDRLFVERKTDMNRTQPHLLWNHRWEYDKGPDRLLALLAELDRRQLDFRISVVGEQFRRRPEAFEAIRQRFPDRIRAWGFLPDRAAYDALLREADVVISTALHDFQGLAMLEAMAAGCLPLAPDRLAYPEYVPAACLYPGDRASVEDEASAAADTLASLLAAPVSSPVGVVADWRLSRLQRRYREELGALIDGEAGRA